MTLADVRQLVVRNHDGLQELMDELEQLATRFSEGDARAEHELRVLALEVATQLQRHLRFEEQHWYPMLQPKLSPRQLARYEAHDQRQRRCVELLRDRAHDAPVRALVDCIFELTHHFRQHTRRENQLLAI